MSKQKEKEFINGEKVKTENSINNESGNNKTVTLEDVLNICVKYLDRQIDQNELQKWFSEHIVIHLYLPIETKFLLINQILYNEKFYSIDDSSLQAIELETKKFWIIALSYTNIQTNGYEELENFNTYDIMFAVMGDWLLSQIKLDYERTVGILENTININNINNLIETLGNLDTTKLNEYTAEIQKQLQYFQNNKEQLKDLTDIVRFNQPSLGKRLKKQN